MELIEITESGTAPKPINGFTDLVKEVVNSTAWIYTVAGYVPPWTGYFVLEEKQCVGKYAFKSPPEKQSGGNCIFHFS